MKNKIAVEAINLSKEFQLDKRKSLPILKEVSFTANYGEFISILGVSGYGKSTLLKCVSSLLEPTAGQVMIDDQNPYHLKNRKLAALRRQKLAVIFQNYNLIPALPVIENICLPLRLSKKKICKQDVKRLLDSFQFQAGLDDFVRTLSGGEQQKVAIARAILSDSQIIFADEPTGALDSSSRKIIFDLLKNLARQGKCVIMVTHDLELASYTDKSLILKDGKIVQEIYNPSVNELYKALEN